MIVGIVESGEVYANFSLDILVIDGLVCNGVGALPYDFTFADVAFYEEVLYACNRCVFTCKRIQAE